MPTKRVVIEVYNVDRELFPSQDCLSHMVTKKASPPKNLRLALASSKKKDAFGNLLAILGFLVSGFWIVTATYSTTISQYAYNLLSRLAVVSMFLGPGLLILGVFFKWRAFAQHCELTNDAIRRNQAQH